MKPEIVYEYDKIMETRKWVGEIPFIKFPSDWKIQIVPPFSGATVRFVVKKNKAHVSVYLDCYNNLGLYGHNAENDNFVAEPYWEVYPYNEDAYRCGMDEIKKLIRAINHSIKEQL